MHQGDLHEFGSIIFLIIFLHNGLWEEEAKEEEEDKGREGALFGLWPALPGAMRIVSLLIVVVGVYLYFTHRSPVASVVDETTIAEATPAGASPKIAAAPAATPSIGQTLRSPIDRTHQVLGQVQKRNGNGEF